MTSVRNSFPSTQFVNWTSSIHSHSLFDSTPACFLCLKYSIYSFTRSVWRISEEREQRKKERRKPMLSMMKSAVAAVLV
jgi:hypothetical protein